MPACGLEGEGNQPVRRAGPDPSISRGVERVHQPEARPGRHTVRDEPVDALGGPCPDVAVAIFEDGANGVAGQAGQHRRALQCQRSAIARGELHAPETLSDCGDPQIAVAVVEQTVATTGLGAAQRWSRTESAEPDERVGGPDAPVRILAQAQRAQGSKEGSTCSKWPSVVRSRRYNPSLVLTHSPPPRSMNALTAPSSGNPLAGAQPLPAVI